MTREPIFLALLALHLLAATAWVGGLLFFVFAVVPAARAAPTTDIPARLGRAFRPVAWTALTTLVVTGPLLLVVQGLGSAVLRPAFWRGPFGWTLGVKLFLVLVVLALTLWHDIVLGPRSGVGSDPRASRLVGRAIGLLSLIIFLAGLALAQGF